jgi:hypothetical protein
MLFSFEWWGKKEKSLIFAISKSQVQLTRTTRAAFPHNNGAFINLRARWRKQTHSQSRPLTLSQKSKVLSHDERLTFCSSPLKPKISSLLATLPFWFLSADCLAREWIFRSARRPNDTRRPPDQVPPRNKEPAICGLRIVKQTEKNPKALKSPPTHPQLISSFKMKQLKF